MIAGQRICLDALECLTFPGGERCTPFWPIEQITGFERREVRRHVRALSRKGLAEYFRGLTTEQGDFAGAGYSITKAGLGEWQRMRFEEAIDEVRSTPVPPAAKPDGQINDVPPPPSHATGRHAVKE